MLLGRLVEGDAKKLAGMKVDEEGNIWNDRGKVIGRAEPLPEKEREELLSAPFEDFPDAILDGEGNVLFEGQIIGKLVEGDAKKLKGKKVCLELTSKSSFRFNDFHLGRRRWRCSGQVRQYLRQS